MADETLDIRQIIDSSPVGSLQVLVIVLCACLVFLDGFDAQGIGYVAPALIKAWHVAPVRMGSAFSAGLVGLMVGALSIAPLADRVGRRPIVLLSTLLFGVFSLVTVTASSTDTLVALRFLTGLGLGGCMPNAISLTAEFAPQRRRSLLLMIMLIGFTIGSLVAGLVSAQLITRYGWQSVFVVGGLLPLLAVVVLFFVLPESIGFLVLRHPEDRRRIVRLLQRIDRSVQVRDGQLFRIESQPARISPAHLFQDGRGRSTLLLWVIFFMSLLDIYLLVSWLPTAMNISGASIRISIFVGATLQAGGLIGALLLGWLLDRSSARTTLVPAYLLAALCIAGVGVSAGTSVAITMLAVFGAGVGVLGGQTAADAVAAIIYPTAVRSTGVGWALGIGRIGSIIGPAFAGVLLSESVSIRHVFFLSALPALCAALAACGLSAPPAPASVEIEASYGA